MSTAACWLPSDPVSKCGTLARWVGVLALAGLLGASAACGEPAKPSKLTAAQIVARNVAARGGLEAWRRIQTVIWVGHIETTDASAASLPFTLEMKRPGKTRFEIGTEGQRSERIFDGAQGWSLSTSRGRRPSVRPYTPEEVRFARDAQDIDGPLIDYETKGIAIVLDGMDVIEGHKAYRLSVKLPTGSMRHVWLDARTFLDLKYDRESRRPDGQPGTVSVFYRNYRNIDGLQIPLMLETASGTGKPAQKMVIDTVTLNPPLTDRRFAKPKLPGPLTAFPGSHSGSLFPMTPRVGRQPFRPDGSRAPGPSAAPVPETSRPPAEAENRP